MRFTRRLSTNRTCCIAPICLLLGLSLPAQEASKNEDLTRAELRGVLLQTRDAVVSLAAEDDSSFNGSISDRVKELVECLLYVDDREDVRYLQRHLKKAYGDEIRSVLEPSATLQDFASRVSKASREKKIFEHDKQLQTIVSQEIERGFIEDAVNAARMIRLPGFRSGAFIEIAVAQHRKGNDSQADDAVTAAIHACFQPGTGLPLIVGPPDRQLTQLAGALADGYPEEAQRVLREAEKAVEAKAKPDSFDWSNLTQAAINVGDFSSASRWMQQVEGDEERADLQTRMAVAQAQQAGADATVRTAMKISDPWVKIKVLRDTANKQSEAGESIAAITTLRLSIDAANRANERQVLPLHDLAWAQMDAGDRIGSEHTLELALQENEKSAFGQDQVDAWALLADTFAYLGQVERAHKIASKISDHYFRGRALGFIAQREVEAGHSEEALAWAKHLSDPDERASAYLSIAKTTIQRTSRKSKLCGLC
jgi:tetratricopeptide (TPR) repeat protein